MGVALVAEGASVTVVVVVEAEEALAGAEVGVAALGAEAEEEEDEVVEVSSLVATGVVVGEEKEEISQGRM